MEDAKPPERREPAKRSSKFFSFFTPHRTIPRLPWTASHRWELSPIRFVVLIIGLSIFGLGEALLIQSHIGNSPWSVLAQGIARHTPLSIGEATFAVSAVILLLWWPLRERPGFGTIANIIVIAAALQVGLAIIPTIHHNLTLSIFFVLAGIALVGAGSSLYITTGLGPGPRDGLMTSLHHRTGVRVARVRLAIEIVALTIGALLGGTLGIGTALFALLIGQSVAINLAVVKGLATPN